MWLTKHIIMFQTLGTQNTNLNKNCFQTNTKHFQTTSIHLAEHFKIPLHFPINHRHVSNYYYYYYDKIYDGNFFFFWLSELYAYMEREREREREKKNVRIFMFTSDFLPKIGCFQQYCLRTYNVITALFILVVGRRPWAEIHKWDAYNS